MVKVVEEDDGNGGTADKNNREYGGAINKNGIVYNVDKGEIIDLSKYSYASVSIEYYKGESIFHSHPSGALGKEEKKDYGASSGTKIQFGSTETISYCHAPSNVFDDRLGHKMGDIYLAKDDPTIKYVFARKSLAKVYIYNNLGVLATLPHKYFVTFKK